MVIILYIVHVFTLAYVQKGDYKHWTWIQEPSLEGYVALQQLAIRSNNTSANAKSPNSQ